MDDGDLIEVDLTDLDLNQEPYGSALERSDAVEERRVFQLGPVSARIRQHQRWRQSRNPMEASYAHSDTLMVGDAGGGVPDDNANVGGIAERGKGYKRDSSHLMTQTLAFDSEIRKADKEDGSFYDCNICLDIARDPVLTICGHLFCWPCLYQVPKVHSTVKQCPVCKGEVSDSSVIPIYGNGDSEYFPGENLGVTIPPRPKARRVESIRQQHVMQGLSYVPVSEAIRQIIRIGALSNRRHAQGVNSGIVNSGIDSQIGHNIDIDTTAGHGGRMHQVSRVLSDSAASLSSLSSTMNNAERLVEDLGTAFSSRMLRLHSRGTIASNSSNGLGTSSQSNLPFHRRLGMSRILERDSHDIRESRRRRLN